MANRIIVIGGGVVGLSAAWALRKRGWTVTVVTEREPGYGASRIHAGWLIPGSAHPVPEPGLVGTSMRWMASSSSPLYIQPRPSPEASTASTLRSSAAGLTARIAMCPSPARSDSVSFRL